MISFITLADSSKREAAFYPANSIPADSTTAPIQQNPSFFNFCSFINFSLVAGSSLIQFHKPLVVDHTKCDPKPGHIRGVCADFDVSRPAVHVFGSPLYVCPGCYMRVSSQRLTSRVKIAHQLMSWELHGCSRILIRLAAWAVVRLFGGSSISLTPFRGNLGIDRARISTSLDNSRYALLTTLVSNSAVT